MSKLPLFSFFLFCEENFIKNEGTWHSAHSRLGFRYYSSSSFMSTLHSTGALSAEQHAAQEKRFSEHHQYDYVFIGTGISALTAAALLANTGKKVCLLEAHDIPGGYGHNFKMGDFTFCAQIHYIWGAGPGDNINQFLKKLGLEKELTFEVYDADGYDHMVMPDGTRVQIPYGYDRLTDNLEEAYPGSRPGVEKFLHIVDKIHEEERRIPSKEKITFWDILTKGWSFRYLLRYRNKTLQQVFDQCDLPKEVQAVLCAQAGDFMSPPEELSILAYAGLFGGYNTGAYYPTKHFRYYVDRIAKFITDHEGCHIYYETPVTKINTENDQVVSLETEAREGKSAAKTFTAQHYVCNADPQQTAKNLIGWNLIPEEFRPALSYDYSPAGVMMYLGLKDLDLKKHGFGSFNIWHMEQWDMNQTWKEQKAGTFDNPWFFMSTASLHTEEGGVAPEGMEVMEVATFVEYQMMRDLKDQDPKAYRKKKEEIADKMLDLIEAKYIPNFRNHIVLKVIGSSTTNEDFVRAPFGTAYGSVLNTKNVNINRLKSTSPFKNLSWCNASSGHPGFHGTTVTGIELYKKLTGDYFYTSVPGDPELIAYARKKWEEQHPELPVTS